MNENKAIVSRVLTASPNPVQEVLAISWKNSDSTFVKNITVISMNGNIVRQEVYNSNVQEAFFSFVDLPSGLYLLLATFNDQKKQTIKIMKR